MPSWLATRRASSTSATEQQPESDSPPHSLSVAPTTASVPWASAARAAATDESTPPDMATRTRTGLVSQAVGDVGKPGQGTGDILVGGGDTEGEAHARRG